jgi:ribosomal protein S18 acetylase RimI-like enzyme
MYYRSDWPEVGLPAALGQSRSVDLTVRLDDGQGWVQETEVSGATFRWVVTPSKFESNLYGFPVWNLHLEVDDADDNVLAPRLDSAILQESVNDGARQLSDASPWGAAYVCSKLIRDEPLYSALRRVGFEEVEHRRLYTCRVGDIVPGQLQFSEGSIRFTSLAEIAPEQSPSYREQILDICREAFEGKGHSRHFTDPILLERLPGMAYILAVMELNFEQVPLNRFLVAMDTDSDEACGFSVLGKKPGLEEDVYTQLLSAVRKAYRGQGIYRGLTSLLAQKLPQDAKLLNVTHVGNRAIQRAYQGSGRVHLADTVVLRRVSRTGGGG